MILQGEKYPSEDEDEVDVGAWYPECAFDDPEEMTDDE